MKRIAFVTGGTGFVGSHLVEELQRQGYDEVRCLVRSAPKWLSDLDFVPVHGELSHENVIRAALRDVTHVYHVGGITRARDEATFMRANVEDTMRLLRAVRSSARGLARVVVTSTLAVVGVAAQAVADEQTPLNPISRYGRSKATMEERLLGKDADGSRYIDVLPITVVRPPPVYGPRDRDIFTFFQGVNRGLCPVVRGDKAGPISLVHVSDLVRGMVLAAEADSAVGETYFLSSERPYSWPELRDVTSGAVDRRVLTLPIPQGAVRATGAVVELLGRLAGRYPAFNREKAMELTEACKAASSAKAAHDFGYQNLVSIDEGISSTIQWYRKMNWLK